MQNNHGIQFTEPVQAMFFFVDENKKTNCELEFANSEISGFPCHSHLRLPLIGMVHILCLHLNKVVVGIY
jgi:hypothetical protein